MSARDRTPDPRSLSEREWSALNERELPTLTPMWVALGLATLPTPIWLFLSGVGQLPLGWSFAGLAVCALAIVGGGLVIYHGLAPEVAADTKAERGVRRRVRRGYETMSNGMVGFGALALIACLIGLWATARDFQGEGRSGPDEGLAWSDGGSATDAGTSLPFAGAIQSRRLPGPPAPPPMPAVAVETPRIRPPGLAAHWYREPVREEFKRQIELGNPEERSVAVAIPGAVSEKMASRVRDGLDRLLERQVALSGPRSAEPAGQVPAKSRWAAERIGPDGALWIRGPVSDVASFAAAIDFARVARVDPERRTIVLLSEADSSETEALPDDLKSLVVDRDDEDSFSDEEVTAIEADPDAEAPWYDRWRKALLARAVSKGLREEEVVTIAIPGTTSLTARRLLELRMTHLLLLETFKPNPPRPDFRMYAIATKGVVWTSSTVPSPNDFKMALEPYVSVSHVDAGRRTIVLKSINVAALGAWAKTVANRGTPEPSATEREGPVGEVVRYPSGEPAPVNDGYGVPAKHEAWMTDLAPPGGVLVGFKLSFITLFNRKSVGGLIPLYRVEGKQVEGKTIGNFRAPGKRTPPNLARGRFSARDFRDPNETIVARPGYGIEAIRVIRGVWMEGFWIDFARIQEDGTFARNADRYTSTLIGSNKEGFRRDRFRTIGDTLPNGGGRPAIGIAAFPDEEDNQSHFRTLRILVPAP